MKKILVLAIALVSIFAFASCGPKEVKAPEKVALENVYLAKKMSITDEADLYGIIMSGDKVFFNGSKEVKTTDENGNEISDYHECIYVGNADLTDFHELYSFKSEYGYDEETRTDYGTYLDGYNPGKDGSLWLSFTNYKSWFDSETEEYSYEDTTVLKRLNADGSFAEEIDVSKILNEREEFASDSYSKYINQVFETSDSKLITIVGSQYVLVMDTQGNFISLAQLPENRSPSDIALLDADTLRITAWDWSGAESKVDIIDYSLSKNDFKTVDSITSYHNIQMSDDGTVYINDYTTISKYDFDKKEEVVLLDFINSDINSDRLSQFYPVGNDEFYAFEYDANWEGRQLLHLTPASDGDIVEKYIITLAANALDTQLKSMIIDYNRSSKDYRITVKVYGWEEKDTEQFDLDLLSGNTPDIVCIDSSLSLSKYATKGIFADMGAFLDSDKDINRDMLLPNVISASEINGKLYSLPVNFAIRSVMMKKSIVGDRTSLNYNDILSIMKSFPGSVYLREMDREQLMNNFLPAVLEDFIDYKTNKSNFSDGNFAAFLDFAKTFPAKIDYETYYNDIDWELYEKDYKENRALANILYISNFEPNEWYEEEFGEEVTYIGFPTNKNQPHALVLNTQFAIGAKSRYKEEAWSFMKMLLGKDYQSEYVWDFPVNKEVFDEMKEKTITSVKSRFEKEAMEDDYFDDDFIMDDDMIVMPRETVEVAIEEDIVIEEPILDMVKPVFPNEENNDPEKLQHLLGQIEHISTIATTTTRLVRINDPTLDIISSDVGAYFDSKKSAEETCKTIESRVNLYLSENS